MIDRCPACHREGPHRTLGPKGAYAGGGPDGVWTVVELKKCRCGHTWALRYLEDRSPDTDSVWQAGRPRC